MATRKFTVSLKACRRIESTTPKYLVTQKHSSEAEKWRELNPFAYLSSHTLQTCLHEICRVKMKRTEYSGLEIAIGGINLSFITVREFLSKDMTVQWILNKYCSPAASSAALLKMKYPNQKEDGSVPSGVDYTFYMRKR